MAQLSQANDPIQPSLLMPINSRLPQDYSRIMALGAGHQTQQHGSCLEPWPTLVHRQWTRYPASPRSRTLNLPDSSTLKLNAASIPIAPDLSAKGRPRPFGAYCTHKRPRFLVSALASSALLTPTSADWLSSRSYPAARPLAIIMNSSAILTGAYFDQRISNVQDECSNPSPASLTLNHGPIGASCRTSCCPQISRILARMAKIG